MELTIKDIDKHLAYKFLRGSWSHGIAIEGKSDYDYGGVYFAPKEYLLGLRSRYNAIEQISDDKNDETYYEFGRWIELLLKSNPTALESLFVDKKFVIGEVHPAIQRIIDNREKFLSKECFNPLIGYSLTQIKKATGYNKKCHIPEDFERKGILDFCYTFKKQGSQPIKDWLRENKLDQRYCGLVNIPNMHDVYGVYYDFAAFFHFENIDWKKDFYEQNSPYNKFIKSTLQAIEISDRIEKKEFYGYSGIVNPEKEDASNDVRLSSVVKGQMPICYMNYNKDGFISHCREYREWDEWKRKRNQIRYSDNKGYNFDAKNMCETVRLIHTGIELARDGQFNVERTWDRDFLLDIKQHKVSYEEISKYIVDKKAEFDSLLEKSTLPEKIDAEEVNKLLIDTRKKLYIC